MEDKAAALERAINGLVRDFDKEQIILKRESAVETEASQVGLRTRHSFDFMQSCLLLRCSLDIVKA